MSTIAIKTIGKDPEKRNVATLLSPIVFFVGVIQFRLGIDDIDYLELRDPCVNAKPSHWANLIASDDDSD